MAKMADFTTNFMVDFSKLHTEKFHKENGKSNFRIS